MRTLRQIAAVSGVAFTLAAASAAAHAEKLTIMVGGATKIIYLPAKLTEQLGYFKDEGLDVEILSQPAGVDAENELLAGAVQGVVGFYDHTIDLQTKGKEVKAIVVFGQVPGEVEMVSTKAADAIKSMADVKGKTLGVTGLGSSTSFLTQYLAGQHGIQSTEYTMLPVGEVLREEARRRAEARHAERLALDVGHRLDRVGRFRRHHLDFARHLPEHDDRLDFLTLGLQIDGVIVEADDALHGAGEQFVLGVDAGRLRQQFDVEPFVLEVAELLGQARRQIDQLR